MSSLVNPAHDQSNDVNRRFLFFVVRQIQKECRFRVCTQAKQLCPARVNFFNTCGNKAVEVLCEHIRVRKTPKKPYYQQVEMWKRFLTLFATKQIHALRLYPRLYRTTNH